MRRGQAGRAVTAQLTRLLAKRLALVLALGALVPALGAASAQAETAIAIRPAAGVNELIAFDTASPGTITSSRAIFGGDAAIRGIDVRPSDGTVFFVTVTPGSAANSVLRTYALDPGSGTIRFVGQTAAALAGGADLPTGWSVDPGSERTRYVNTNDENARVNLDTGALAGNDTDLTPAATTEVIAEAHAASSSGTTLYAIERNDSQLAIQGGIGGTPSPNGGVVTDLAPLGFTLGAGSDGGFDVSGQTGTAYAALTDAADSLTRLYTVSLPTAVTATPVATPVGPIGDGTLEVRSLAILPPPAAAPQPEPQQPPVVLPPADTKRAIVLVALRSSAVRYSSLLRGLTYEFSADEAGAATGTLSIRGAGTAVTLARGTATLVAAGKGRIRVRPTASGRRALRRLRRRGRRVRATLTTAFRDLAGNRTSTRKRLTLRR